MNTGKTIALTRRTFLGQVMSLVFNMLSRLVITFIPRSERLNFRETKILRYKMYIAKLVTTANANNVVVSLNFHIDYNKGV